MPFLVSTKRLTPDGLGVREPNKRLAVATLEEAIAKALEITLPYALVTQPTDDEALRVQCHALTESGGTVGPLPDGTLIEVERVTEGALLEALGWTSGLAVHADLVNILAAYNARES